MSARSNASSAPLPKDVRQGGHVAEMQRRRLLLAIGEVVGESGIEAAGVSRVCEQAGVSRRTFYELFEDREECLLAAFDAHLERLSEDTLAAYAHAGGWRERLRHALSAVLEQLDADPYAARLCIVESLRAGPRLVERRRSVLEALTLAVDEGRTEIRGAHNPPPLTSQGVVGGALSVLHARLLEPIPDTGPRPLAELTGPLMAMIVHPYLGPAAAASELDRPTSRTPPPTPRNGSDPFKGLPIRFTYRTARVLSTIASDPGASNRHIAECSGIADEGQVSRLLGRLHRCELIENHGQGRAKGEPNAWTLTERGAAIHQTITVRATAL